MKKKYNWQQIQEFYDNGNSWREVMDEFGVSNRAVEKAVLRGDLKLRDKSSAMKLSLQKHGPRRMGETARKELSIIQSTKNRGGKSKWYNVSGQLVQGTWERDLAIKFDELGIKWIKLSVNKDVWPYVIDGKLKHYTPDFYLPEFNVYLDPKGYWWGDDKRKIEEVKKQHCDKKLLIIEKDLFKMILNSDYGKVAQLVVAAD